MPDPAPPSNTAGVAVLASLLAVVPALRFASLDHAVDDAWISFRAARNLVELGVLTFEPTAAPVEGMTNLLWTLLSAAWIALAPEVDPIHPARAVGLALHGATAFFVVRAAARLGGASAARSAGLLFASLGWLGFYALSGLETPLFAALFAAALAGVRPLGIVLGLLAATRPEGMLAGAVVAGMGLVRAPRQWPTALAFAAIVAALEAFRLSYYGSLLPNTFFAKPPDAGVGLAYALRFLTAGGALGGLVAAIPALRRSREAWAPALVAVLGLAGVAWSGGDWMPAFRRCALEAVALCVLAGAGLSLARGPWRALAATGVLAWAGASVSLAIAGADGATFLHDAHARLGRAAAATPSVDSVALIDIGRFGWEYPGRIVDLAGLTDAHVARLPGTHAAKEWDEAWFRAQRPAVLFARSETPVRDPLDLEPVIGIPERPMVLSVLDRGGYRLHGVVDLWEGRCLLVFRREDVRLPPELWGPEVGKDLRELLVERRAGR